MVTRIRLGFLVLLLVFCTVPVGASERGELLSSVVLRDDANHQSAAVTLLQPGDQVTIELRSAQWMQVRTATELTGWVEMSAVRLVDLSLRKRASGVFRWLRGSGRRAEANSGSITVGIRGLAHEDERPAQTATPVALQQAEPNFTALTELESFQVDAQTARNHADQQQLVTRQVPPL